MKHKIAHILIPVLLMGGASLAYAQTEATENTNVNSESSVNTTQETQKGPALKFLPRLKAFLEGKKEIRTETKTDIKTIKIEAKGEIKNKREEAKTQIQEKRADMAKKRVENRFEKMNDRFQATIERLGGITSKIQSRIEKIKNAGGKTEPAEKFMAEAKVHLDLAKASLVSLKAAAETEISLEADSTGAAKAKDTLAVMRKIAKELETHLRETRVALEKAVGSLKGVSTTLKTDANANSTVNTNN